MRLQIEMINVSVIRLPLEYRPPPILLIFCSSCFTTNQSRGSFSCTIKAGGPRRRGGSKRLALHEESSKSAGRLKSNVIHGQALMLTLQKFRQSG